MREVPQALGYGVMVGAGIASLAFLSVWVCTYVMHALKSDVAFIQFLIDRNIRRRRNAVASLGEGEAAE